MSGLVGGLESVFRPWADVYGNSAAVKAVLVFLHVGGTMAAGGFALAADRAALRLGRLDDRERIHVIRELSEIHRPVLLGLAVVVLSGLAMLAGDLETLLPSAVFWVKMGMFALLLLNGVTVQRAERRMENGAISSPAAWRPLRAAAVRSSVLWFAVVFLGALLSAS